MNLQVHDTDEIGSDSKGQNAFNIFLKYLGTFFLVASGLSLLFESGGFLLGCLQLITAVLFYLYVHNIFWGLSNSIREFVMPSGYVSHDFGDAFRKKIFWHVGPQFFGFLCAVALMGIPILYFGESKDSNHKIKTNNHVVQENNLPNNDSISNTTQVETPKPQIQVQLPETKPEDEKIYTKEEVEQLEKEKQYSGNDPIIRKRLGLPPKP